jgi:recombinational DNA repair protein RecR
MNLTLRKQEEKVIYQTLYKAMQIQSKMYCSGCGGRYSEDNTYICQDCGRTWGYCCVPSDRKCNKCRGEIR